MQFHPSTVSDPFHAFRSQLASYAALRLDGQEHLYRVALPPDFYTLFFLHELPEAERQTYNCRACRQFVERYGGLVTINEDGQQESVCWSMMIDTIPELFRRAVSVVNRYVVLAQVQDVFLSPLETYGLSQSPETVAGHIWTHLYIHVPEVLQTAERKFQSTAQAMAEKREDFRLLGQAVGTYSMQHVQTVRAYLATEQLYRGEHVLGVADWFLQLHQKLSLTKHRQRKHNLLWQAVATARPGWCHIGSTMIGTLLDDIAADRPFEECKSRFAAKMSPLRYQRPQAPPNEGALDRAERLVAQIGISRSLERRTANLDDMQEWLWQPRAAAPKEPAGIFDHLRKAARRQPLAAGRVPAITWVKFRETVLPAAEAMSCFMPTTGPFMAFTTAQHADAPPILQWDREIHRNPVAWYFYNCSTAAAWNLTTGSWTPVVGLVNPPYYWGPLTVSRSHHGDSIFFLLRGARDMQGKAGIALFPEILKSEYREIRAAIEAYSKEARLGEADGVPACGMGFHKDSLWNLLVRVEAGGIQTEYQIDRWD